ncbi:MAG: hypothetical protein N2442_01190 [Spirochaetes bacterium]|nr:hypothetical protein [Spirochaetota bacterium]
MQNQIILVWFINFSLLLSLNGHADSSPIGSLSPSPLVLSAYTLEGLKKTHPEVLKPLLDPFVGKPYTLSTEEAMLQSLRSLGLFHRITFLPQRTGLDQIHLTVQLEEKWTLIPIPIGGATSGGNLYGGLLLFESNLFGWNKKFYGGAFWGNNGFQGMFGYLDPRFFSPSQSLMLRFGIGTEIVDHRTTEGSLVRRYEKTKLDAGGDWMVSLGKGFGVGVGFQFREHQEEAEYDSRWNPPTSERFAGPTLTFRYQDLFYGPVLVYGVSSSLRYERGFNLQKTDYFDSVTLQAQGYVPFWGEHRIGARVQGFKGLGIPAILENRVSGRFLKTIGDDVFSNTVLMGQLMAEGIPIHFRWGAPTLVLYYEGGVFRNESPTTEDPYYLAHGPGAGVRIYLSKVAIPAFGFDITYSVSTKKAYGFLNVGFQL